MQVNKYYHGLNADPLGGINPTGTIIRDAWVFQLLPETEDCSGWTLQGIESLYDKVSDAWATYGHLVSNLPEELRARHERIYTAATAKARSLGWNPDAELEID